MPKGSDDNTEYRRDIIRTIAWILLCIVPLILNISKILFFYNPVTFYPLFPIIFGAIAVGVFFRGVFVLYRILNGN